MRPEPLALFLFPPRPWVGRFGEISPDVSYLLVEHGLHATHWFAQTQYALEGGFNFDGESGLSTAYRHNYVDNEAITVAAWNGEFKPCLDSVVEHRHHLSASGLPYDDVYKLGDESKTEDMLTFHRRLYAWLGGLHAQSRAVPVA